MNRLCIQFTPMLLILHATLLVTAPSANAHHFKGLPHFSYFENYPQVPQEEYLGQEGEFEFSLVLYDFQGIKRDAAEQPDDVRLFLVVYNLTEGSVYNGPLTLEILDGRQAVYGKEFMTAQEESIYPLQYSLPSSGDYSVRINIRSGKNVTATIPFKLSSQIVHWGKWVSLVLVIVISVVAVGSRRARIKMDRKMEAKRGKK